MAFREFNKIEGRQGIVRVPINLDDISYPTPSRMAGSPSNTIIWMKNGHAVHVNEYIDDVRKIIMEAQK